MEANQASIMGGARRRLLDGVECEEFPAPQSDATMK
jgi:hypothetical protein